MRTKDLQGKTIHLLCSGSPMDYFSNSDYWLMSYAHNYCWLFPDSETVASICTQYD
jgi:hypothetical protein